MDVTVTQDSRLTRLFQLSIYILAGFSILMLTVAEGRAFPVGLGLPLVVLAYFFTERWQRLALPLVFANVLGLFAAVAAGLELAFGSIEARLLSGAHLLTYLLWIVLFVRKTTREYWWITALGVLLVAVGAVLTSDATYGLLLICYFFWSIWTLSVFSLFQSQQKFNTSLREPPAGRSSRASSEAVGGLHRDPNVRWISGRFLAGTTGTASGALLLAAVFFLLIPRVWIGRPTIASDATSGRLMTITGFTDEIQLGSFGQILESAEPVMEVRFRDNSSGEELDPFRYAEQLGYDEPLFRGAVLNDYRDGQWSRDARGSGPIGTTASISDLSVRSVFRRTSEGSSVDQEIRLEPIGTRVLFAMAPVWNCRLRDSRERPRTNPRTHILTISEDESRRRTLAYVVESPRSLPPGTPIPGPAAADAEYLSRLQRVPARLERLPGIAREIAESGSGTAPLRMARKLEAWFRDSGEFGYSVVSEVKDPDIDPVEDFIINRRQGHCEYFASALALALRAVGIPARLVTGFKGGYTNPLNGALVVEQRHAHAWVEAYLDDQWMTLDPTPAAARAESVQSMAPRMNAWVGFTRLFSTYWSNYVVNMNIRQQQQRFYEPLQQMVMDWRDALRGNRSLAASLGNAIRDFVTNPSRWFSWQGGFVSFVLLLLLCAASWLARRLWHILRTMRAQYRHHHQRRVRIAFYERFQAICAALGLVRGPAETQREFANSVDTKLSATLAAGDMTELPTRLTDLFYRIRFGEEDVDAAALAEIDSRLTQLEGLLHAPASRS